MERQCETVAPQGKTHQYPRVLPRHPPKQQTAGRPEPRGENVCAQPACRNLFHRPDTVSLRTTLSPPTQGRRERQGLSGPNRSLSSPTTLICRQPLPIAMETPAIAKRCGRRAVPAGLATLCHWKVRKPAVAAQSSATGTRPEAPSLLPGRRRDCHLAVTPASSVLKHPLKGEGSAAE